MERYDPREKRAMKHALHKYKQNPDKGIHVTERVYIKKGKRKGRRLNMNYYLDPTIQTVVVPERVHAPSKDGQLVHDIGRFLLKRGVKLVV